jgi:hypothetical protein
MNVLAPTGRWRLTRRRLLFAVALMVGAKRLAFAAEGEDAMSGFDQSAVKRNRHAPAELSRFEFLIGSWRFKARVKVADGSQQTFEGTWVGRYILDGYAIADEYRMTGGTGEVVVLGMNFRTYDAAKRAWNIRWLNGLTGTWANLVSEELGGVTFGERSVTYAFREPTGDHAYTRATYTSLAKDHFTWRGEQSADGKSWGEFMLVDAVRA